MNYRACIHDMKNTESYLCEIFLIVMSEFDVINESIDRKIERLEKRMEVLHMCLVILMNG